MVALVGPSGAGKTTISNLVPRLYDVTTGSVRLSGIDVRHATMASVRDVVGVVTQDPHLFHDTLPRQPDVRPPGSEGSARSRTLSPRRRSATWSATYPTASTR